MKCPVIPDYNIVKPGLPTEFGMDFSGIDRTNPFVLIYDNAQGAGFPLFIFPAGFGNWGFGISEILDIFGRAAQFGDAGHGGYAQIWGGRGRDAQIGRPVYVPPINQFINNNDPVHMIWHHDKFPQFHEWKMIGDFHPKFMCDFPGFG